MKTDLSIPLRYGLIGGLVMSVLALVTYMFYNVLFSSFVMQSVFGILSFGLTIFIPVWGTVSHKRSLGKISFLNAFAAAMIIIGISMAFSSMWSYVIPNVIDTAYPEQVYEKVKNTTIESMEKFGASDEDIEKATERFSLEDFKPTALKTLRSFGISLGVGTVLSLIIAVFVSRPDPTQPKPQE